VSSALFLLLFSEQLGYGIKSATIDKLTTGTSVVFSQFILFVGILIFVVGAAIISFIVFLMMTQRTKDFGLIKAAGCPNGLVFGYFLTQLIIVTFVGCLLGVVCGFVSDSAAINLGIIQSSQKLPDLWLAVLVFVAYFVLALIFGIKPILDATRLSPIKAMSPIQFFGLTKTDKFKPLSRSMATLKIALRSLYRRQSTVFRIVFFLSVVFVLLTVCVAGSIIASDTTKSWVAKAVGKNVVVIGTESMCNQYKLLLSTFSGAKANGSFDYLDGNLSIPNAFLEQLNATPGIINVDPRLLFETHIREISNFTIDPQTLATIPIGDSREGDSLVVGVEPSKVVDIGSVSGRFLGPEDVTGAVIGDSTSQEMFSQPLIQSVEMVNMTFNIVGVRVDPINNGRVVYAPAEAVQNAMGFHNFNIVLVKLDSSVSSATMLKALEEKAKNFNTQFRVSELDEVLNTNLDFLGSQWSLIMLLSLFSLASATLCVVSYLLVTIEEQREEFSVLRAVGAKPKTIVTILTVQSMIVLFSSFAVGISLGIMLTLLILVPEPAVTIYTVLEIGGWMLASLFVMLIVSIYPAVKFARKPLLSLMR
jgi:ABC-type antimicrobial peptide transport system permease subunit